MSWKQHFTFRDKRYVEHEVEGQTFRFYPNRLALLQEARELSAPVAKAISVLFADESRDSSTAVKRHREGEFYMEDITTEAISEDMAAYRQKERDRAIDTVMATMSDRRSLILLGRLFMDSMREEFEYKVDRSAAEVEEFIFGDGDGYLGLDLPVLMAMFQGWMRANAKVFGDAGERMVGLVRERLEHLQPVSSSEEETRTSPTNGEPSKTLSSQPSEPASQQST